MQFSSEKHIQVNFSKQYNSNNNYFYDSKFTEDCSADSVLNSPSIKKHAYKSSIHPTLEQNGSPQSNLQMNEIRTEQVVRHGGALITQIVAVKSEYILSQSQGPDFGPHKNSLCAGTTCHHL